MEEVGAEIICTILFGGIEFGCHQKGGEGADGTFLVQGGELP